MAIREIVQSSKSGGGVAANALLRSKCVPAEDFGNSLEALAVDLVDTMTAHRVCVGLAAPQIGVGLRVAVAEVGDAAPLVLVNPEILASSGKRDVKRESCMSLWGYAGAVERREKILVRFQDQRGEWFERSFRSFPARVVSHEVDHLDGVLYDARLSKGGLVRTDLFDGD